MESNRKTPDYNSISLSILAAWREQAEAEKAEIQQRLNQLEKAIADRVEDAVTEARGLLYKDFGVVRVAVEDCEIVHDIPKRVDWDSDLLDEAADAAINMGIPVKTFFQYKLSVPERAYQIMPNSLKAYVDKARTLKGGKAKIVVNVMAEENA